MCSDRSFFTTFQSLKQPQEVTLGDGHELKGTGQGTVALEVNLHDKTTKLCELRNVLYVQGVHLAPTFRSSWSSEFTKVSTRQDGGWQRL